VPGAPVDERTAAVQTVKLHCKSDVSIAVGSHPSEAMKAASSALEWGFNPT